jgi:putative transposase
MRKDCPKISLRKLCGLFGKTRHAYYDSNWRVEEQSIEDTIVLDLVTKMRKQMPKLGTPKLYYLLKEPLEKHGIKMGRDKLHELLSAFGMLVRRKRKYAYTTNSHHWLKKYSNLIRDLVVRHPEQLWVSDITYISLKDGFNYLSLITDAYSRKIIGYCLSQRLDHYGCLSALNMALAERENNCRRLIHHSDRGIQYCSKAYVDLLQSNEILISMTENGDPYENAIAERINGILKTEFDLDRTFGNSGEANKAVEEAIRTYNNQRPHASCDYLTPEEAHGKNGILRKRWKTYRRNYSDSVPP